MSTIPGLPVVEPRSGLPPSVRVYEVAPRDGLQAEAAIVPTPVKIELVLRLRAAGLRTIETTSFVSPRWVPQLGDAREVTLALEPGPGVRYPVLVPNEKGLERAMAAGARDIAVFASATETFARRNLNRDVNGVLEMFRPVVASATAHGMPVRGYVSMCFGDPWEGPVSTSDVVDVSLRLREMGCETIAIGDTIGVATPGQVLHLVEELAAAGIPPGQVAMHFHDTYGQALANVFAALTTEITEFDASAGGIGGCPYARSATGNLATEDLVWMLNGLGIAHGVDLDALTSTSLWMAKHLGRPSPSRVVSAFASGESTQHGQSST